MSAGVRDQIRAKLEAQREQVLARHWPGRTGPTDRDVLAGLMAKMIKVGSTKVSYSVRDAQMDAGKSNHKIAGKALRRLEADNWFLREDPDEKGHAATYKSLVGERLKRDGETARRKVARSASPDHEVWVRLRGKARDVYECLTGEPMGVRELARAANADPGTVSRTLPKLAANGLAARQDHGWIVGPWTPDEAAEANTWVEDNSKVATRLRRVDRERDSYRLRERQIGRAVQRVEAARAARPAQTPSESVGAGVA